MADLKIGRMVLGPLQTNGYFVYREGCNKVIFIDPADAGEQVCLKLKSLGFEVAAILLTHGHADHIAGCSALRAASSAKVYALDAEEEIATAVTEKQLEFQLMSVIPLAIIGYLRITAGTLLEHLYGNITGMIVMTGCLAVYGGCYLYGKRLLEGEK